jgi:nicotinamidase-related amidase
MKAIVIIDVQEAYLGDRREGALYQQTMAAINAAAAQFRLHRCPVIVVRDLSDGDGPSFDNVRELHTDPADIRIEKTFNNSFWQTDLDSILRKKSVDWVLLCGNAAEFCVAATYFGALERGYTAFLLRGGIFAATGEGLISAEKVRPMLNPEEIPLLLKTAG